jgi:hypothetical protein
MRTFEQIQIHSCFASYSSNDVFLYREITKGIKPLTSLKVQQVEKGKGVKILYYADETFDNIGLDASGYHEYEKTPEFKALVKDYMALGFSDVKPKFLYDWHKAKREAEHKAEVIKRIKQGYVVPDNKVKNPNRNGGFSKAITENPIFKNYACGDFVFGYTGHSSRTHYLDKIMESVMNKIEAPDSFNKIDAFCTFLGSTSGRHFMDSLEDLSKKEQKKYIYNNMKENLNTGYIYNLPEHEGSLNSTLQLQQEHRQELLV